MIAVFAKLHAQPGRRDELVTLLDAVRVDDESEPGTLVFTVHTARDDENAVLCYEVYRDEAAIEAHRAGPAFTTLMDVLGDLIDGPPELDYGIPVGTSGLILD